MRVYIKLTTAGLDSGPFDLYTNIDGYNAPFNVNPISRQTLVDGYLCTNVPDTTIRIKIQSVNQNCSNSITLDIILTGCLTVSVTIATPDIIICSGSEATFTATPVNGGDSPSYQWKVNGVNAGTNSSTYTYIPLNGDVVTCVLTSSELCTVTNPVTSNIITMTVTSFLPASVSIVADTNPICQGQIVTLTPTPINGGATPIYDWFKNGEYVSTASTLSYIPINGDEIYVIMTSNLSCVSGNPVTSNTITMVVYTCNYYKVEQCFTTVDRTMEKGSTDYEIGDMVQFTLIPDNGHYYCGHILDNDYHTWPVDANLTAFIPPNCEDDVHCTSP